MLGTGASVADNSCPHAYELLLSVSEYFFSLFRMFESDIKQYCVVITGFSTLIYPLGYKIVMNA